MEQHTEKRGKNLEWLLDQPVEIQFEIFRHHIELSKLLINQLLQDEVVQKAGEKYTRAKPFDGQFSRWGYNPGSVRIGEEKVKMEIPRLYDNKAEETVGLENYQKLKEIELPSEQLLKKIILGLSEHDYKTVTQQAIESFGLSQSSVSRAFMEQSSKILEDFEQRDLSHYDFVALVIDGKHLLKEQVVIALGVTNTGDKIPLGFIQTTTENSIAVKGLLKNLIERNFQFTEGLLAILDGAKGLAKAIKETFGEYVVIQRCQWHKRENVVSYLKEEDELHYRGKLQRAYLEPEYNAAKNKLLEIRDELKEINRSAANSLEEGLEETLTIHKLGLIEELGKSLTTTNIIENLNSQLNKYVGRIKRWVNPEMQARWVATALVEVEQKMRRINNHKKLYLLRTALKSELKLEQQKVA
ncbi:MAG: transposase [Ignavibacteria bacterium]|nr:transposase [Ignavibacteria bacterium]